MKQINNLNDLKEYKRQLKLEQQLLGLKIKDNRRALKEVLQPANIVNNITGKMTAYKKEDGKVNNGIFKTLAGYTARVVQQKLIHKAVERLFSFLKK